MCCRILETTEINGKTGTEWSIKQNNKMMRSNAEAYLETCRMSLMEFFYENSFSQESSIVDI